MTRDVIVPIGTPRIFPGRLEGRFLEVDQDDRLPRLGLNPWPSRGRLLVCGSLHRAPYDAVADEIVGKAETELE